MTHHEAFEHHDHPEHHEPSGTCRVCSSPVHAASRLSICEKCGYKILILLVVVMVAISYVAWFGVL